MFDFLGRFLFLTPDFGHSDLWHLNFSLKFFLSQALHNGYLPLWSKDIGTGFPIFGEGQIGLLNIFNLIIFRLFNPVVAFNLSYIIIFITTFTGSYFFGKILKLKSLSSFFLASIFSLSGVFVTHISHFNLIQAASYMPWEFFLVEKYLQTKQKKWLIFFSLLLSQQIYAGFPQMVLISLFAITIYMAYYAFTNKNLKTFVIYSLFTLLGVIFALPQILASWQLISYSFRSGISVNEMARFPYLPTYLLTFLNPYIFGDPRIGTFPAFSSNWGIFWESTGYIGVIPVLLLLLIFKLKLKDTKIFLIIACISLVLMLGKYSPLFFVFQIPPLNLFRVPARFLILFVWAIAILASFSFNKIKNRGLAILLILCSLANILYFATTYNAVTVNANDWLKKLEIISKVLEQDKNWYRVYPIIPGNSWNEIFLKKGWKNIDDYKYFRNYLDGNQNLLWNIPSIDYYTAFAPRRLQLFNELLSLEINPNLENDQINISSSTAKLISITGVKYIISPKELLNSQFTPVETISNSFKIYIYKNENSLPHAYTTNNYIVVNNLDDLSKKLVDPNINAVIMEENINLATNSSQLTPANVIKNTDLEVDVSTNSEYNCLLVLADSYYPGWKAYIDSKPSKIYPVNLNQRGVIVPAGKHTIKFKLELF